jgi:hypothetical protein
VHAYASYHFGCVERYKQSSVRKRYPGNGIL